MDVKHSIDTAFYCIQIYIALQVLFILHSYLPYCVQILCCYFVFYMVCYFLFIFPAVLYRGVHGNPRGVGIHRFSPNITEAFCQRNNIQLIIRSHQFVPHGYKIMHSGRLITVFSARNYFEREENDGALILLSRDDRGNLQVRAKKIRHGDRN